MEHNGFFCGLKDNLSYVTGTLDFFDNCCTDTFSLHWIHDFINQGGNEVTARTSVYWLLPGHEMRDGLCLIENDSHILAMMAAVKEEKLLYILVDQSNFIKGLRDDVIIPIPSKYTTDMENSEMEREEEHEEADADEVVIQSSTTRAMCVRRETNLDDNEEEEQTGSDSDSDFYDSDFDAEDGDDDLFLEYVSHDVNDNNEHTDIREEEDDAGLEHEDLNLSKEDHEQLRYKFQEFNAEVDMEAPQFKIGMIFSCMTEFRRALNAYSVNERVKIVKTRNEATRLNASCDGNSKWGCPWMIKASEDIKKEAIVVREYCGEHTCERLWEVKTLTAPYLTQVFLDEFRDNQKLDLQSFCAKVTRKFSMCPNRYKLGRARKAALNIIHGDEAEQFSLLRDYGQELRRANPGSTFYLSTNEVKEKNDIVPKEHLATLYWSYDASKRGFLEGCRPLICIDGCHIKTRYKGNLLTAVGIDPNDCIYPIAMGLVEVECTSSWEWFLTTLKDDLNITNTAPFTIMSDKQKGLINAVKKVFPDAEHRFCVRHLYQNFHKKHKGETLKNDLWAIARSTNIPTWERNMAKMKVDSEEAYNWVEELQPSTWIKAFFSEFPKCDMLLNNHSEVFNSYILQARELPVLSMLETIFYKLMHRNVGKLKECEKWNGTICPKIKKKIDKATEWAKKLDAAHAGKGMFHVKSHEYERTYTVDMPGRRCDCKRWQMTGIPCHHAIACCREDRRDPCSLVHTCYSIATYRKAYAYPLVPLRSRVHWEKVNAVKVHPPLYTKVMGRPKKSRRKTPEEKEKNGVKYLTRKGMIMHCTICGNPDHNKKGHDKWVLEQNSTVFVDVEDEDYDDPTILQHIIHNVPDPRMDPTQNQQSMVYLIGQEDMANMPLPRVTNPLPEESSFVVAARDSIPAPRVTTAQTRGSVSARGRGRGRVPSAGLERGRGRGQGRGRSSKRKARTDVPPSSPTTSQPARGRGRGRSSKRKSNVLADDVLANDQVSEEIAYNTGPGSAYHLLFGDDQVRNRQRGLPDLNEIAQEDMSEEIQLTQNAPQ